MEGRSLGRLVPLLLLLAGIAGITILVLLLVQEGEARIDLAEARAATVKRVERDLLGLSGWWYVMTPHYCLVSDLDTKDPANADLVRRMANGLEGVREGYVKLFPPKQPIAAVSVIKVFDHQDQLFAHFSERSPLKMHGRIMGMWVNV